MNPVPDPDQNEPLLPEAVPSVPLESRLTPTLKGSSSPYRQLLKRVDTTIAIIFLITVLAVAVLAPLIAPYDPTAQDLGNGLLSPSSAHWLGTDDLGRDVLSRMIYAGRTSLYAAAIAVLVGMALGVIPGIVAGYFSGWFDAIVMRVADATLSFPPIVLAMAVLGALGPNLVNAMLAIGVILAPRFTRLMRGVVMSVREETFISVSQSIGTPSSRIIVRHIIPNIFGPLVVQIGVFIGIAMLAEAGLSFLGLGVQPPQASWGSMLGRSFQSIYDTPLLAVWPGLAIAGTVLAFNVCADGLRDAMADRRR